MPEQAKPFPSAELIGAGAASLLNAAVETAREFPRPELVEGTDPRDGTKATLIVNGAGVRAIDPGEFDRYRKNPLQRVGRSQLTTLQSFVDLVNRFKQANSAIFARDSADAPGLLAVFDYHPAVAEGVDEARHMRHLALYQFPLSEEWKAWTAQDGKQMEMPDFAAFLEDHIADVVADAAPTSDAAKEYVNAVGGTIASPSKLIDLSRRLHIHEASTVREARNLTSGEAQLTFETQHTDADGKPVTLPSLFMICIPIFARSETFDRLLVRLRYRKRDARVVFWFEIWRPDLAFQQAFADACAKAESETGLPLFVGTPEA